MNRQRNSNLFRRLGVALAATFSLASVFAVPSAHAAAVYMKDANGVTTGTCNYSSASVDANGNFTYNCSGAATGPGLLSFSTASATTASDTGTTVAVNRTAGVTGAATANLSVTGAANCVLSTSVVTFSDGSNVPAPSNVTVTPSSSAGSQCVVALAASGAGLGSVTTFTVTVGTPPPPPTLLPVCSPTATPAVVDTTGTSTLTANCSDSPFAWTWYNPTGAPPLTGASGTVGPFPTPGVYTYSITGTNAVGTGAPNIVSVTVTPAGATPPAGCTTTANTIVPWTTNTILYSSLKTNESVAFALTIGANTLAGGNGKFSVGETTATGATTDVQFALSRCPGDFDSPAALAPYCSAHTQYTGGTLNFTANTFNPGWYCQLPAGATSVYLNVRQVRRPLTNPPATSCSFGVCPFTVNFN